MTEKTFVVFINIVTDDSFLTLSIISNRFLETIYNLFQNRIVEYQFLSIHHSLYICFRQ